jgi:hypothetical protein
MNEALMIGVPLVVIIAGILLNRQDVHALRGEMQALRGEMQAGFERQDSKMQAALDRQDSKMQASIERLDSKMQAGFDLLHSDLREFDRTIGQHDSRLDTLEERTKKQ